jgi:hypothetical protein
MHLFFLSVVCCLLSVYVCILVYIIDIYIYKQRIYDILYMYVRYAMYVCYMYTNSAYMILYICMYVCMQYYMYLDNKHAHNNLLWIYNKGSPLPTQNLCDGGPKNAHLRSEGLISYMKQLPAGYWQLQVLTQVSHCVKCINIVL